ncbi:SCO2400 family protein [Streptomyces sp. LZ34]
MDYCPACRRHLNGALACPGCGAYAEEYAYPAAEGAAVDYGRADGHRGGEADVGEDGVVGEDEVVGEDADGEPSSAPGAASTRADRRKASRRKPKPRGIIGGRARRARRGRGRRVTIMASVLGPVLAGLFVAEIATEGGIFHEPSSSSSPDKPSEADRSPGEGDSSGPRTRESGAPSAGPSAGADGASADEGRGDDEDGAGKDKKKPKDSKSPSADDSSSAGGTGGATATATGGGGGGATRPPTSPSDPDPTTSLPSQPTPSPTETCDRFLWWCT